MDETKRPTRSSASPTATGDTPNDVNDMKAKGKAKEQAKATRKRKQTPKAKQNEQEKKANTNDDDEQLQARTITDKQIETMMEEAELVESDDDVIDVTTDTDTTFLHRALLKLEHENTMLRSRAAAQHRSDSVQSRITASLRKKEQVRRQQREDKALAEELAQATQDADTNLEEGERRFVADGLASHRRLHANGYLFDTIGADSSKPRRAPKLPETSKFNTGPIIKTGTDASSDVQIVEKVEQMLAVITRQHNAKSAEQTTKWTTTKCQLRVSVLLRVIIPACKGAHIACTHSTTHT